MCTTDLLNKECSVEDIYTITAASSGYDFDWERVGRRLIGDQNVKDIKRESSNEAKRRENMLLEWKKTKARQATYQALVNALQATGYKTTAERVKELVTNTITST